MSEPDTIVQNDNCHLEDTISESWLDVKKKKSPQLSELFFFIFLYSPKNKGKIKKGERQNRIEMEGREGEWKWRQWSEENMEDNHDSDERKER